MFSVIEIELRERKTTTQLSLEMEIMIVFSSLGALLSEITQKIGIKIFLYALNSLGKL